MASNYTNNINCTGSPGVLTEVTTNHNIPNPKKTGSFKQQQQQDSFSTVHPNVTAAEEKDAYKGSQQPSLHTSLRAWTGSCYDSGKIV